MTSDLFKNKNIRQQMAEQEVKSIALGYTWYLTYISHIIRGQTSRQSSAQVLGTDLLNNRACYLFPDRSPLLHGV